MTNNVKLVIYTVAKKVAYKVANLKNINTRGPMTN